ncbi:rootletin-like [Octopus sinensis]|uniref:Rootletin-like n=1 Tax=Octopus sinensis TaxID=2607531 RepID=A0A7E6EIL9_9MOLL|nr:rootletin-like [Octopus sinensis]
MKVQGNLKKENKDLCDEVQNLEAMLSKLRLEKDELAQKYNTLLESSAATSNETDFENILPRRNNDLVNKLEEERQKTKQKIEKYQKSEQRQADLIQRLQSKVFCIN